ncbi:MAG: hypothetical protein AAB524_00495 [Patescibacteria group bacterium]
MWLIVAIGSYFLFAVVALIDKYLLSGPLPNPKTYVFYIGVLGGGVAALIFVFGFVTIPALPVLGLGLIAGVMRICMLLLLFAGLRLFEASRIIPAFGGTLPVFTFLLTVFLSESREIFLPLYFLAFLFLLAGTVAISYTKDRSVTTQSFLYASGAAFFGSSSLFFSKFVYQAQPFFSGLAWLLLGAFVTSLILLMSREVRRDISKIFPKRKEAIPKSARSFPLWIFLGNQAAGGSAVLLQNLAIALVPFGLLPFVSAMGGIEYLALFLLTIIFLRYFPSFVKEETSRGVVIQKFLAITLISIGLALLAL